MLNDAALQPERSMRGDDGDTMFTQRHLPVEAGVNHTETLAYGRNYFLAAWGP